MPAVAAPDAAEPAQPSAAPADPADPPDPGGAPRRLYVPVRDAGCATTIRLFRDRFGARCAVGFTSAGLLRCVLGRQTRFHCLSESLVRDLVRARGAEMLVLDPGLVAAPVGGATSTAATARPTGTAAPTGAGTGSARRDDPTDLPVGVTTAR